MMAVCAIMIENMQCDTGILRQCLEELTHKFGVESADFGRSKRDVPDQKRPAGQIDRSLCHRLVHCKVERSIARNPASVSQRLGDGLSNRNAGIFYRMVIVDVKIALTVDFHIDQRMSR